MAALLCSPALILESLPNARRLLLFGETGIGKSTLAVGLARQLAEQGRICCCISADPGSPAFGTPGAVCLARWRNDGWQPAAIEALCSLDAVRFRLPLISAVRRLAQRIGEQEILLIDAPGVVRSVAGAELLTALVEAAGIDTVLMLARNPDKPPLANELAALGIEIKVVLPSPEARRPGTRKRALQRTRLWDSYLQSAVDQTITPAPSQLVGTPPPLPVDHAWRGRQIAYLRTGQTLALGEVIDAQGDALRIRIAPVEKAPDQILIRDSHRNRQGWLTTFRPAAESGLHYLPPPDVSPYQGPGKEAGPIPVARLGEATAILVNGVFGDPLLHVRLHNRKRSLLFDLGEGGRLPARLAHQVTDVFISHGHVDHIGGFLWLLRSRIGVETTCRLYGPPGLAEHIAGFLSAIHWDRIGETGPRFAVAELHGSRLLVFGLQAGKMGREKLDERLVKSGLLLEEPGLKVRAAILSHNAISSLAYALEFGPKLNIRRENLVARDLAPGAWLARLKEEIAGGNYNPLINLPDGSTNTAGELAFELIHITPAQKLVYATDLAPIPENRRKLAELADGAHIFFCEAAFVTADARYAEASGHLTARMCGEIASAAHVERLVPFHFSRRYEHSPLAIYEEVKAACRRTVMPKGEDLLLCYGEGA